MATRSCHKLPHPIAALHVCTAAASEVLHTWHLQRDYRELPKYIACKIVCTFCILLDILQVLKDLPTFVGV